MTRSDNSGHGVKVIDIDPVAAAAVVAESGATLLDVREDDEWAAGHAPGAVHRRLRDLDVRTFDGTAPVVTICKSGRRSGAAASQLAAAGVTVYNVTGGMTAWQHAGLRVIRDDGTAGAVI
ncbi:rhodanese-like domain-containing protein [Mycolicibacterium brisbanense]|uniref:Rhodanese domain-containing protein n=1 Tax=Mycolicibacterium brisbanense TaxID=146020 RepID=A0A100VV14_9MYCO|nr:rhodanese-like domain-containing protein [Mycolicibacterium brisbanense]MCV7156231.1 rhodanese-like domain-containing protein [Mycolicibacterium brisbanense]GAS86376.1 rhodanese domain-containing protein [Mycolicibacterium brisbanense]